MLQPHQVLIAIPAYNEQRTIEAVIRRLRENLPEFQLLVVNDGSSDGTADILRRLRVPSAVHLCNLGYGRAIQTAIRYAAGNHFDYLITLDADGQHHPEQVRDLYTAAVEGNVDVVIGSRSVARHDYSHAPLDRRIGMQLFSVIVRIMSGQRVYDTTSGLKVLRSTVFGPLSQFQFVDFHAEAIVYLTRLGYRISEHPITVSERAHGQSMHSIFSVFTYPLNTALMVLLGVVESALMRRRRPT